MSSFQKDFCSMKSRKSPKKYPSDNFKWCLQNPDTLYCRNTPIALNRLNLYSLCSNQNLCSCVCVCVCARSVVYNSLQSHELSRLFCPWNFPDKNTCLEVGCHFLLQGIFPTQGSNLPAMSPYTGRWVLLPPTPPGKPLSCYNCAIENTGQLGQSWGENWGITYYPKCLWQQSKQ